MLPTIPSTASQVLKLASEVVKSIRGFEVRTFLRGRIFTALHIHLSLTSLPSPLTTTRGTSEAHKAVKETLYIPNYLITTATMIIPIRCFSCGKVHPHSPPPTPSTTNNLLPGDRRPLRTLHRPDRGSDRRRGQYQVGRVGPPTKPLPALIARRVWTNVYLNVVTRWTNSA